MGKRVSLSFLFSFDCLEKFTHPDVTCYRFSRVCGWLHVLINLSVKSHWVFIFWIPQNSNVLFYSVKKWSFTDMDSLLNTGLLYCW